MPLNTAQGTGQPLTRGIIWSPKPTVPTEKPCSTFLSGSAHPRGGKKQGPEASHRPDTALPQRPVTSEPSHSASKPGSSLASGTPTTVLNVGAINGRAGRGPAGSAQTEAGQKAPPLGTPLFPSVTLPQHLLPTNAPGNTEQ